MSSARRYAVLSRGILRIPRLATLLDATLLDCSLGRRPRGCEAVLGWGRRPSSARARAFAARHGLPFVALEDGFLRSVGLGAEDAPLSVVVDPAGIYYDAGAPSRLDELAACAPDAAAVQRADALIAAWRAARVSKYNHLREYTRDLPRRYVLVVDQTRGDASIRCGMAETASFERMLRAALEENPDCTVLLKTHPDVFAGKAAGCVDAVRAAALPRVEVLAENVHPVRLIEHAQAVYVVTSQIGFEALLHGVPVRCFGMPFYAGRGLTRDELPAPPWRGAASLQQLVHAALIAYPRYLDPETGERCEVERLLEHLALQRRMRERFAPRAWGVGFSAWKRPLVARFLQGTELSFVRRAEAAPAGAPLVVWGQPRGALAGAREVLRLEDGFLRSVGLGADLVTPVSWVMDRSGLYYDATRPSDLERLLQAGGFDAGLRARAAALRRRIVEAGLTKYNVDAGAWRRPPGAGRVILVPGQVETDAAIALGAPGIRTNLELLRAVRAENPGAYVVYKPHPDVVAGLRRGGIAVVEALRWCDELVTQCRMDQLLDAVDEVEVLSSLAGFEALLRGKRVSCHGQPFYAGWGLTTDRIPLERRSRRLDIDELVAGTLILYPAYLSRASGRFTTPERALDELLAWRSGARGVSLPRRLLRLALVARARLLGS